MNNEKVQNGSLNTPGQVIDALAALDAEVSGQNTPSLAAVRVDANERLLVPFTTQMVRVRLHYLETPAITGYVHCDASSCVLCKVGKKAEDRDLVPVYDVEEQAVAVLAVGPNLRPEALRPQLMPALRRLQQGERILLSINRPSRGLYEVAILPMGEGADDGADKILEFLEHFEKGAIDLGGVFPRLSAEELASIPKVAAALKAKGINL